MRVAARDARWFEQKKARNVAKNCKKRPDEEPKKARKRPEFFEKLPMPPSFIAFLLPNFLAILGKKKKKIQKFFSKKNTFQENWRPQKMEPKMTKNEKNF